jgi:hypothetical protein
MPSPEGWDNIAEGRAAVERLREEDFDAFAAMYYHIAHTVRHIRGGRHALMRLLGLNESTAGALIMERVEREPQHNGAKDRNEKDAPNIQERAERASAYEAPSNTLSDQGRSLLLDVCRMHYANASNRGAYFCSEYGRCSYCIARDTSFSRWHCHCIAVVRRDIAR